MANSTALQRYLQRHIETGLPDHPAIEQPWQHVVVIPAYREASSLLQTLSQLNGFVLVILVLNRPESDHDEKANNELRSALASLPQLNSCHYRLNTLAELYVLDTEFIYGTLPVKQGVGLARKYGCDLALKWLTEGAIESRWIHSSDADALPPENYLTRLQNSDCAAATFPFKHSIAKASAVSSATALYELRLHYYVLGLHFASSPYAFYTLGSSLAFSAEAYAQVRGFPKRAAGEDFYLLNKLAKVGNIEQLTGDSIGLEARTSLRVPFGTGPAVQRIVDSDNQRDLALFYHPDCFVALKVVLSTQPLLHTGISLKVLTALLKQGGLPDALAQATTQQLFSMGLPQALTHCGNNSRSEEQFNKQFKQWFDGFRTLKFIHGLRQRGYIDVSLNQLQAMGIPNWMPGTNYDDISSVLRAIYRHQNWS